MGNWAGGSPNPVRDACTTFRPSVWFPRPPTAAPMPNGSARPTIVVPCRAAKRLMN
ncbi:hypothetical protein P9139_13635 [Curtobacterium flaccumfaciens]|nr:hypothetical protein P9139_13635 [Curtobacterium flaccumfaciens]